MSQVILAKELNEVYIEYYNDFLTVDSFASYKGWSLFYAKRVIKSGRKINRNVELMRKLYAC